MGKTVIVGMGALGLLFGQQFADNLGEDQVVFLMDEERRKKHEKDVSLINGKERTFQMASPAEIAEPASLVVVATKYNGLRDAMKLMRGVVGKDTTIVALLNGISSEEILAEEYPREQIIDTVAIGMDAVRNGTELTYHNMGRWQLGLSENGSQARLDALCAYLDRAKVPYELCTDIKRAMWSKFMLNVGVNQTCMIHNMSYIECCAPGKSYDEMLTCMREVMAVGHKEGVMLTEEDLDRVIGVLHTLAEGDGCPSMLQDRMAGRKSEVELFAGTVIRLGKKHGVPVSVNEAYYDRIQEIESAY